jgi:hypothetical protein
MAADTITVALKSLQKMGGKCSYRIDFAPDVKLLDDWLANIEGVSFSNMYWYPANRNRQRVKNMHGTGHLSMLFLHLEKVNNNLNSLTQIELRSVCSIAF